MNANTRLIIKKLLRLFLTPIKIFPIKFNRVLLLNELSYNYAGNPKAVTEFLLEKYPNTFEIIYALNHPDKYEGLRRRGVKVIKFNSLVYFYYLMTCRVFLTNSGGYSYVPLRMDKQFVINTHHGGGALKKMGVDMFEDTETFREDLKLSVSNTTLSLSTSRRMSEAFSESCLEPIEIMWEIGMPRNDMLIHLNQDSRASIRSKLRLHPNDKLVLFAPTYRKIEDSYFNDSIAVSYGIDEKRVCMALGKRFGGKWKFAIRYHPCVVNHDQFDLHNMIDLTDYEDIQELLIAADVLINDFSSTMWDFMLTGKPCFVFAVDFYHYLETTGSYVPPDEWPYSIATTNEILEQNILAFDEDAYRKRCKAYYEALGGCETGDATKLVAEKIYHVCYEA